LAFHANFFCLVHFLLPLYLEYLDKKKDKNVSESTHNLTREQRGESREQSIADSRWRKAETIGEPPPAHKQDSPAGRVGEVRRTKRKWDMMMDWRERLRVMAAAGVYVRWS
jgi:hypothetical protein